MTHRSPPPPTLKKTTRRDPGPASALSSSLAASQEEISQKRSEMEEFKNVILSEMKKLKKDLLVANEKTKEDIKKEVISTVRLMMNEWKEKADAEIQSQMMEIKVIADGMERRLDDKIDPILIAIDQQSEAIGKLNKIAELNNKETEKLRAENKRLSELLRKINEKCIDLEGRQRRKNLRIVGLREGAEGNQDPRKFAAKFLKEILNMDEEPLLGRAHRALRRIPGRGAPPRQMIVKVVYDHVFEEMMKIIIRKRNLKYEGENISIFRDYPAEVAKKRALFRETRGILRDLKDSMDLRYGLVYPAILRVTYDRKEFRFVKHNEALEYARKLQKKAEGVPEEEEGDVTEEGMED